MKNGSWEKKPNVRKKRTRKDRMKDQLPRPFNVSKAPTRDMQNWLKGIGVVWEWEPDKPVFRSKHY